MCTCLVLHEARGMGLTSIDCLVEYRLVSIALRSFSEEAVYG
jgi:hypothetical protein